ncbi:hypothetical protein [Sulfolobus sp. S-194]|uniref:hypothetical protein n=1 Tax=Sulfolobus sp. S-194 TaxID=2512240 RepID=UPI0025704BD3|nr:hypothetical protein [Sulfolobus sp. S-194]
MANPINQITKRGLSILLGVIMFLTSVLLITKVHINLSEILFTFNPYPFYFIGLIFGVERIFYGITGSSKLLSLIMGGGEYSSLSTLALFIFFLSFGLYVIIYTIAYTQIILQMLNVINGISYLLFSLSIFKAWHM